MKWIMAVFGVLTVCFSLSSAAAHNKVVVIPLHSASKLANVVTVSLQGGDFTSPVAAVNSITDAGPTNPYVVLIGPGVYTLTETLVMKEYVSVMGTGEQSTKLTGAISTISFDVDASSAIVSGADNVTLSDLTVENTGGSTMSSALYNENSSPLIQNVTASAYGGVYSHGVYNVSSSPTMTNMTASATGGNINHGVINISLSSPTMSNMTAIASLGNYNFAVGNQGSSPTMTNMTASASGGTHCTGVYNDGSSVIMSDVTAIATGGTESRGVYNINGSPTIRNCTLKGDNFGMIFDGGTTHVMRSSILGVVSVLSGGTLTCVNSDNGVATPLSSFCQPEPSP
ncbi:MAG: hypothetical protein KJ804_00275 [Proteobacteria bacterium]|nr:hypothetical protein [Pseudomonadota bacterium]MBU1056742.1 hypothetical protein [Pseudomonadota bacterium]